MSFEALARIRGVEVPGASALLLLYILAEYAGDDGCCWPSQATLAQRARLSVRAVRENLRLLEECGLIERETRNRKDGTRASDRTRLLYYVPEQAAETAACLDDRRLLPRASRTATPAAETAACGADAENDQRQISAGQPAADAGPTTFEPITEAITLPSKRVLDDAFEKWFSVYPRKAEKTNARRLYDEAVRRHGATLDELLAAAQRYAIEVHGSAERWIKNPTTWLQGECWRVSPANVPTPHLADPEHCSAGPEFAGPSSLRAAIVAERGEAWARSWLDPCGWDEASQRLIPRTGFAANRIAQELRRQLQQWGVTIGSPERRAV